MSGGPFYYGSGQDRDSPAHEVILTKGFYLSKYEVTQEEYQKSWVRIQADFEVLKNPVDKYHGMMSWHFAKL